MIVGKLASKFIKHFIESVVYDILTTESAKSAPKEALYEHVKDHFMVIKADLQTAISEGFEAALTEYSGKVTNYYCLIKPTPEPVNKEPC